MATQIRILKCLRLAFGFLTVFPVGRVQAEEGELALASFFFPLVGMSLGFIQFWIWWLSFSWTQSLALSAFFGVLVLVIFTGGLHLDGVADVCDAFWVSDRDRRKAVLKDSRLGTFGALGVFLFVILKLILLMETRDFFYFLWAPLLGRLGVLELAALFPPFAEEGLGKELMGRVSLFFSLFWMAVVGFLMLRFQGVEHLLKIGIHFGIIYLLGMVFKKRFGGLNGDMLGCTIEMGEALVLFLGRF
ncbi:MAG: adenosylcobinamide-GDP ribazoletransferase [Atribacterota bacterium]